MNLEEKIKWIREKEGLSQEGFAECLSASRQSIINWEKGKSTPSFEVLMIIANEFHIEINSLVQKDREILYLPAQEKKIEKSTQESKVFDMFNEPLYFCKKSCFPIALLEIFVFVDCLLLSALSLYLFIPLIDDSWVAWIFITLSMVSSLFFLYQLTSVILTLLKDKASKCYLYENCFYTQEGLKEKRESAFEIDYYEDVTVEQSLLGKIFNYGDVWIHFRPKSLTVHNCKRPYKLKKFIQDTYSCKEDFTEK